MALLMLISNSVHPQNSLEIRIAGLRNAKGNIMIQLLDEKERTADQAIYPLKDTTCIVTFRNLKPGDYAVRCYHDENRNGELDKNAFGKPLEGYCFSNNVFGKFGPPPFRSTLISIAADKSIFLKIRY